MKFTSTHFETKNKDKKCAFLFVTLTIIITGIIILYNTQSVDYKEIINFMLVPLGTQLHHVAGGNASNPPSKSVKNKSLGLYLNQKPEDKKQNSSKILLYRKRRYLQFPEGSSLQLVFNILIPVIDYTNYAILGITCALAFELPSKPLSELEDELIEKLHMDSYRLPLNDSALDSDYIDKNDDISNKFAHLIYIHPTEYEYQSSFNSPSLSGTKNIYKNYLAGPYSPSYSQNKPIYYTNNRYNSGYNSKNGKSDAGKAFDSFWRPSYSTSSNIRRQDEMPKRKQHAVYHIMGKRSIQDINGPIVVEENNYWLKELDRIHLRYHRSSRHDLYSKLEKMLGRQGKNGTECILRALCETGNRRHETDPGELLTEIFRAVFTLPKDLEINSRSYHPIHKAREDAYWNQQNCSQAFPLCHNFIWDDKLTV